MATNTGLVQLQQSPLHISNPATQGGGQLIFNPKTAINLLKPPFTARRWKLRAEAKGFGSNSSPTNPSSKITKAAETLKKEQGAGPGGDEDEIPQVVIERTAVRIAASVVLPMGLGLTLLSGFGALRDQNGVNVPMWIPVATSFLTFGASALGIAYGALSSSWDADREGSVFGAEQLQRNWVDIWKE